MKVECLKEGLVESIGVAQKAAGKNLSLEVLGCILIEAKNNSLTIHATNLDLGIEIKVPAKVVKNGTVAVPGNILLSVMNTMYGSNNLVLEVVNDNLSVSTPQSKTLIKAYSHEDFPTIPLLKGGESFTIQTEDFKKGLESVWFSASTTTIKPELASVYIYTEDKKIYFVATDSFRLSESVIFSKKTPSFEPILIPIHNVAELIKVFEFIGPTEVKVVVSENQISFTSDTVYITSRLISGTYPDYRQIIPKEFTSEVIVLRQDISTIFKKIQIFSDKFNQVGLHVSVKKREFVLTASNSDVGETTETLQAAITGEDLDINFNHRYITDVLQIIPSDSISLSFSGLSKPMVIKGISNTSFLYLVMPMNR